MKIYINNKKTEINIQIQNKTIIYTNESIDELISNFKLAFEGKTYMEINGDEYKKSNFNIIWIDQDFNIKDSEKFNSKSIEYKVLDSHINFDAFDNHIEELNLNIKKLMNQFNPHIKLEEKKLNVMDLLPQLFKIKLNESDIPVEVFRFLLLIDTYKKSNKPTLFMFEDTYSNNNILFNTLLNLIQNTFDNIYFVLFTNKLEIFNTNWNINVWTKNNIEHYQQIKSFREALIIYKLRVNQSELFDYLNYYSNDELKTKFEEYITIYSWYKFLNHKKLTTFEEIFFSILTNENILTDNTYKELIWVDEL